MSPALLAAFRMLGECEGVAGSNLEGTRDGEIRLLWRPHLGADGDCVRDRYEPDGYGLMIGCLKSQTPQESSLDVAAQGESSRVSQAVRLGAPHGFTPPLTSWLSVARSVSVAY